MLMLSGLGEVDCSATPTDPVCQAFYDGPPPPPNAPASPDVPAYDWFASSYLNPKTWGASTAPTLTPTYTVKPTTKLPIKTIAIVGGLALVAALLFKHAGSRGTVAP